MRPLLLTFVLFLAGGIVERCEWTPGTDTTEPELALLDGGDAEAATTPAENPPVE